MIDYINVNLDYNYNANEITELQCNYVMMIIIMKY